MGVPLPTLRSWGLLCLGTLLILVARVLGRPELAGIGAVLAVLPILAWLAAFAWRRHPNTFGPPPKQRLDTSSSGTTGLVPGITVTVTLATPADGRLLRPARTAGSSRTNRASRARGAPGSYTWTPPTRGTYRLPAWIATRFDPLHLTRVRAQLDPDIVLVVGPSPVTTDIPGINDAGLRVGRQCGDQLDTTTRPYLVGDPVRRVHWPVSARQGKLMVRPVIHEADGGRSVLVDRTPAHYTGSPTQVAAADGPPAASRTDFDAAVSTAAAALRALNPAERSTANSAPVGLAAFPPWPAPMPDDEALATAVPAPSGASGRSGASGGPTSPHSSAAHTVLVTGLPGDSAAQWPRTLHGAVTVLLHPATADVHPSPRVTGAWERAGWTWHLVTPEHVVAPEHLVPPETTRP